MFLISLRPWHFRAGITASHNFIQVIVGGPTDIIFRSQSEDTPVFQTNDIALTMSPNVLYWFKFDDIIERVGLSSV